MKCIRPIFHEYRPNGMVEPSDSNSPDDGDELSEETNAILLDYIGKTLGSIKNKKDWNTVDLAVAILSSAVHSGFSLDEILEDVEERQLPIEVLLHKYDVPSPR